MIAALTNHLWQSTVVGVAFGLLSLALRRNRASARHALWMAASLKFAVPFSLLIALGGAVSWRVAETPVPPVTPAVAAAVGQFAEPFAAAVAPLAPEASRAAADWAPTVLVVTWGAGFVALVALRIRGWRRIRAALRVSMPVTITMAGFDCGHDVRSTPAQLEPGVVGIWRPILLVPAGLESALTADQLHAILVHEQHHIQRRDNLTSAMHMAVEAVFWFHPMVWWIGARLIDERERACDEAVLRAGIEPVEYAAGIVAICKQYVESPLACVSGVTGADLKQRIRVILAGRVSRDLGRAKKLLLVTAVAIAVATPITVGMIAAPRTQGSGQSVASTYDVASIRPCQRLPAAAGAPGKIDVSLSRVYLECFTLARLVNVAYAKHGDFTLNADEVDRNVRNGPEWVRSDLFTIEAKTTGEPAQSVLLGTMLRALLDDRFKLRARLMVEQVPMYGLTVANGGLKVTPAVDGDCLPDDPQSTAAPAPADATKPPCGMKAGRRRGSVRTWELTGASLRDLADVLDTDRPVLDQTGVTGRFNVRLEYALDDSVLDAPTLPQALNKLGLRLVSTKGPHEYVVIDHAERPTFAEATAGKPVSAKATVDKPAFAEATAGKPASAQTSATPQKFDVASIRPCEDTPAVPGGRRGGVGPVFSPGMLVYNCGTLLQLIHEAYVTNGEPLLNNAPVMRIGAHPIPQIVRGGPDWARTERFMIEAKAAISTGLPGNQAPERSILMGPMLRALLEERFKVVMHREFEKDVPMYALRVAKGGLKIKPAGPDACIPYDGSEPPPMPMGQEIEQVRKGGKPYCGHGLMGGPVGPNHAWVLNGQTMEGLAWVLSNMMDRHVIDETGVADKFVMYLEYAPDDMVPYDIEPRTTEPPTAPTIAQALKSLGLELQPTKAPKQYIVIDHAERPTFAEAGASASVGKPAAGRQP